MDAELVLKRAADPVRVAEVVDRCASRSESPLQRRDNFSREPLALGPVQGACLPERMDAR